MSAKTNIAAKNVKSEVALRAYLFSCVDILTKAEKLTGVTDLGMVEDMQFERGYN